MRKQEGMDKPSVSRVSLPTYKTTDTASRRFSSLKRTGLTEPGLAFLKCAFAPPDFQATSVSGVPDEFMGRSLTRKHRAVGSFNFTAGNDYWFLLAPVPGVAYFTLTKTAGSDVLQTDVWQAVEYPDKGTMFPTAGSANDVVTKFRFVSNHFEMINATNLMQWSGSIQAWKTNVQIYINKSIASNNTYNSITGLLSTTNAAASKSDQFTGPFMAGFYGGCYCNAPDFEFSVPLENITVIPGAITGTNDFGQLNTATGFPGFDNNFESMVIKVTGVNAAETAVIKTWACCEYVISNYSGFYEFSTFSPHDELAMKYYRNIIQQLPIGVPADQNDNFWTRVLGIMNRLSLYGSYVPGPFGTISKGINLASEGISSLVL
jgi:hypothetical protein